MTTTFDQILPELVRIVETDPQVEKIEQILVIRDLQGCVRLVVEPKEGKAVDCAALAGAVRTSLGNFFKGPILTTGSSKPDEKRMANELKMLGHAWLPEYRDPITLTLVSAHRTIWKKLERRLSKHEWLETESLESAPPWKIERGRPAIVTFYSFKGGVGRSTALVSSAWQLARAGKRVCIVDLDLEAPGIAALLNVTTERGVVDFLVDHVATGHSNLEDCHAPAVILGDESSYVDVIPAGNVDIQYLEKLSRLDFVGTQTFGSDERASPVHRAMRVMLGQIAGQFHPDFILLDARAGLHDIAGLSLHGLAHVDVIVARASEQSYAGLDLTLHALGMRKNIDDLSAVIVHAFAPMDETSAEGKAERTAFRSRVYASFVESIYSRFREDDPPENDSTAAHHPYVLNENSSLVRFSSIAAAGVKAALFGPDFKALRNRIEELCEVSDNQDVEDDQL